MTAPARSRTSIYAASQARPTGLLILQDGTIIEGTGFGASGNAVAEVCFNTAITGYQEILTDPSYAGQIVTFTFPHIGNVGANDEDLESLPEMATTGARGLIVKADITTPSNWRSVQHLDAWLHAHNIIGLSNVDTRALTALIREKGAVNGVIAHSPTGEFDIPALTAQAAAWGGLVGLDLVPDVGSTHASKWDESIWNLETGYPTISNGKYNVVVLDFGIKRNILRLLVNAGCALTIMPANTPASKILALKPDGVFLSNGPGDPAATGVYAVPIIQAILEAKIPTFGICLGHQMLALAVGGKTLKMHQGHHGANHPVQDTTTGKVEITAMNHGFAVDAASLPANAKQTHISLFDGTNCGIALIDRPAFSVQHHPEASPGPEDSHYLFARFVEMMETSKKK